MLYAEVALIIDGSYLVYAGIGYQKDADFNRGDLIGKWVPFSSDDNYCQVQTSDGKRYFIKHGDYYNED